MLIAPRLAILRKLAEDGPSLPSALPDVAGIHRDWLLRAELIRWPADRESASMLLEITDAGIAELAKAGEP